MSLALRIGAPTGVGLAVGGVAYATSTSADPGYSFMRGAMLGTGIGAVVAALIDDGLIR